MKKNPFKNSGPASGPRNHDSFLESRFFAFLFFGPRNKIVMQVKTPAAGGKDQGPDGEAAGRQTVADGKRSALCHGNRRVPTPPIPRFPQRNSWPYDQGLLTIGFP